MSSLFPAGETHDPVSDWLNVEVPLDRTEVTPSKVKTALKRGNSGRAPGPDGVTLGFLRCIPEGLIDYIAGTFSVCLSEGVFPRKWKRSRLVLIPKGGGSNPGGGIRARPICLLNDVAKLFEKIIATRLREYMEDTPETELSARQFGFRRGRSTTDALRFITDSISNNSNKNRFTIAVGLDIRNAFNSISWPAVRNSLDRKGLPLYLRRIVDHYLFERDIEYPINDGSMVRRTISCGVPQGSVLGPLLWNLASILY